MGGDLDGRLAKLKVSKTDTRYVPLTEMAQNVLPSIRPKKVQVDTCVFLPHSSSETLKVLDIPYNHFKRSFGTARKKAGLDDLHHHELRYTAASHLLM